MLDLRALSSDITKTQSRTTKDVHDIIIDIYKILCSPSCKTKKIIAAWRDSFSYIYGEIWENISSNKKINTYKLLQLYGIQYKNSNNEGDVLHIIFAIQTFFSVFTKSIMYEVLSTDHQNDSRDILLGNFAIRRGITNYCTPDWYTWPVFELENGFTSVMEAVANILRRYKDCVSVCDFAVNNNHDHIKQMYEAIIPKELRHALGEHYSPDWLAEEALQTLAACGADIVTQRVIDPTCGSGTFLLKTIQAKKSQGRELAHLLNHVIGMDINPLAVLTAKTNYILAIIDLLNDTDTIEIPIYNTDILNVAIVKAGSVVTLPEVDFIHCADPVATIMQHALADSTKAHAQAAADVIIGNPPWVNWEYLPEKYRLSSQHLWGEYHLLTGKGRDISFSKEDISVLITYVVADKLLKVGGALGFVIRQAIFKSAQNGAGFRHFMLKGKTPLRVLRVDDLSSIKVFGSASNKTALLFLRKGEATVYPVTYIRWEKKETLQRCSFTAYSLLCDVKKQLILSEQQAIPAVAGSVNSLWATARANELRALSKVLGTNHYRARTGVFTGGANGVYWLNIEGMCGDKVCATNSVAKAKRKVRKRTVHLEKTYLFPMIKGSNIKKWAVDYDTYLLCPHTARTKMQPVAAASLQADVPETYAYLAAFKEALTARKGFAGWEKAIQRTAYHAVLRIGAYTFSKYKVVWKYIATEFVCAVVGSVEDTYLGHKLLIPNEKVMYISTDSEDEAYYLCGILSATLVVQCVKSYMHPTSISAHVLDKLHIPTFDAKNQAHLRIAHACKQGHITGNISKYLKKIDALVTDIYS